MNVRGQNVPSPSFEISTNVGHGKKIYPLTKTEINIGRAPDNDIVIDENVVSGQHLQVVRDGNQLVLIHPHPARQRTVNGLIYNGQTMKGNQPFRKQSDARRYFPHRRRTWHTHHPGL